MLNLLSYSSNVLIFSAFTFSTNIPNAKLIFLTTTARAWGISSNFTNRSRSKYAILQLYSSIYPSTITKNLSFRKLHIGNAICGNSSKIVYIACFITILSSCSSFTFTATLTACSTFFAFASIKISSKKSAVISTVFGLCIT